MLGNILVSLSFTWYFPINETDIINKLRCPRIFQALSANTVRFSFLPYCLNNYLSRVYLLWYTDLYAINILLVLYIILLYYFRDATKCGVGRICGAHRRWSVLITWLIHILSVSAAVCIQLSETPTLTLILTLTQTLTLILTYLQPYSDHWSADRS